ncbi:MAG: hypothetical protein CSA68_06385 [Rhodobacterales bacterium]|nr:MAG: hypothetical protein CSA68_06385 [Rhodobacterales bacterium]
MISYALKCKNGHSFDSWFQSSGAFEKLHGAGMVACPVCASTAVEKSIMAPRVRTARKAAKPPAPVDKPADLAPKTDVEKAIAELKHEVEANAEYVGKDFARKARQMHDGAAKERSIYGEAKPEEARQLLEDGVPVLPLPFTPSRKTN